MAWSVLQSASGGATAASTLTVTYGSNASSGTKLIAWIILDHTASVTISSVKDAAGNSFTQVSNPSNLGTDFVMLACYSIDTPAGDVGIAPAIKVTVSAAVSDVSMLIQEVSGLASGNAADGTPGTVIEASAASLSQPAYTSSAASEYLVAFFGDDGNSETFAIPSGYTADAHNINTSSTDDVGVAYKNSTGGAESGTWTITASAGRVGFIVVAFTLAAGAVVSAVPQWIPLGPAAPGDVPFTPWPQYATGGVAAQDILNAAATVTAAAAATLDVAKAGWPLQPQYAPAWFPSAPSAPGAAPFTAWPLGQTGVNSAALSAALTVTAAGAAALTESKPLNAASTVTATGAAAETTSKPLTAAQVVTVTAAASLSVVKAGVSPAPLQAPAWFPSVPSAPGAEPFAPWPAWTGAGVTAVPVDVLNAAATITATGTAALTESKPVTAASTVTATVTASLTTSKPLTATATVTATVTAALDAVKAGVTPAPLYVPAWFPLAPSAPGGDPFAAWPPWTGALAPAGPAFTVGTMTAADKATAQVTATTAAAVLTAATMQGSTLTATTAATATLTATDQRTGGAG